MPRPDQRLYSALLRAGERFRAERLPLLGIAGTPLVAWDLSWASTARAALEAPPPGTGLAEGARLLSRLEQQLQALRGAEEQTREALAEWAALAEHFSGSGSSGGGLPFAAAAAAEEGLALLSRQSLELADPLQLELAALEAAAAEEAAATGGAEQPPEVSLDDLSAEARQQHPDLFPPSSASGTDSGAGDGELQQRQSAALATLLYRQHRFRHEPFEWVYEGLQPLLLPPRLRRRKLAPITLAAAAAGVARRLGLALVPVPAESGDGLAAAVAEGPAGGAAAAGGLPLDLLRPDVAQRYAGRSGGGAPPAAGPWVLLLPGDGGGDGPQQQQQQQQQAWRGAMDACTGELLEPAAAQARWPTLALGPEWALRAPLTAWQHSVRTVIQAHQRRGESDLVAHWVYVLLALDPEAEEWGHVLGSSGAAALG